MGFNPNLLVATTDQLQIFFLVFLRVMSMVAFMPIFGSQYLPITLKIGLAFFLSLILFPITAQHGPVVLPLSLGIFVLMIAKEVFVGILIGFVASFMFVAVQFAGRLIDNQMGFTLVELVDPFTDMEVTTMGQLKVLVFTIFFLLFNGHYFLLLAMQKSFEIVPLFGMHVPAGKLAHFFTTMSGEIFVSAFKLAAPAFVALFITTVAMGIIARTVPQINVFFVGLPLQIALGMGIMVLIFPVLAEIFKRLYFDLIQDIWRLLYIIA
jgi:flagellar biosynthetic protein FliR